MPFGTQRIAETLALMHKTKLRINNYKPIYNKSLINNIDFSFNNGNSINN